MNTGGKLSLLFLILGLIAGGAWLLLGSDNRPYRPALEPAAAPDDRVPAPPPTVETDDAVRRERPPEARREVVEVDRSQRDQAQGVKGTVVVANAGPAANCDVYLMESAQGGQIFRLMQLAQRGITLPPVASARTDDQGQFALGVELLEPDKVYEVRVVSATHADVTKPGIRLKSNEWYDAGRIELQRGLELVGQVTVAGTAGMPVADAEVQVKSATGALEVSVTPGRENGLTARTDAAGYFKVPNVPAGVHHVTALAPGFARVTQSNVTMNEGNENRLTFELPRGSSIAGTVTDGQGLPVVAAKVTATALSAKSALTADVRTGDDGGFEIIGLVDGPYQLVCQADGFVDANEKPINAGTKDLHVVMEKQGAVNIRVYGRNGAVLRSYALTVKTYFPGQTPTLENGPSGTQPEPEPVFGNTMIPPKQVRNPKDGVARVEGLNPGQYVLQVNADSYAMAFSPPFTVAIDNDPPLLEVYLNEGGVIEGTVVGPGGLGIADVRVETRPNDLDDNPFTQMFGGLIPYKITRTEVSTDAEGRFRISLLNEGVYQVKFSHPAHVEVFHKNVQVVTGQTTTMPVVTMPLGCMLAGTVYVDGKAKAQAKVTISRKIDPNDPDPKRTTPFHAEAFTDAQGRYVMAKRLPPGSYELMAADQTMENPLMQIVQFQKSRQEVIVGMQTQLTVDVRIAGDN